MKIALLLMGIILAITLNGCEGTTYVSHRNVAGYDIIQGGRTGAFGTDNSFVYIAPKPIPIATIVQAPAPPPEPRKVLLERSYRRSATSWENCKDRVPNKRAKNLRREEVAENWAEEVLLTPAPVPVPIVQPPQQPPAAFWAGGNPSTGNLLMPSAAIAGGMVGAASVLRPSDTNVNQYTQGPNVGDINSPKTINKIPKEKKY